MCKINSFFLYPVLIAVGRSVVADIFVSKVSGSRATNYLAMPVSTALKGVGCRIWVLWYPDWKFTLVISATFSRTPTHAGITVTF
jgi:hypothetical protein